MDQFLTKERCQWSLCSLPDRALFFIFLFPFFFFSYLEDYIFVCYRGVLDMSLLKIKTPHMREKQREREGGFGHSPLRKRFCTLIFLKSQNPACKSPLLSFSSSLTFISLMRIRKRPMLPFFPISPPPQIAPDLPQQHRDERLEKKPRARAKQDDEEEDHGAEAKERRSGFDPTTHHSKDRSDGWIARQEMKKRCCMLSSTPIPEQVEVGISNNYSLVSTLYFSSYYTTTRSSQQNPHRNFTPFP